MVALAHLRLPTRPRPPPTPIDSICTGSENFIQKTSSIQEAGRNSYKMIANNITTLFI